MDKTSVMKKRKRDNNEGDLNLEKKDIYSCNQCEYTGSRTSIYQHKRSKHEGIRYPCDQCEYAASHLPNLESHIKSKHEGVRYPCDQCDYAATTISNLKRHKLYKHDSQGIRYPCDECEYSATAVRSLKIHKESKHKGIIYPCDQCEYTGSKIALYQHKRAKHEGVRYPCDQCKYVASQSTALKRHIQSKHEGIRYPCDQCEYAATSLSHLKTHKKNSTHISYHPCDVCDYVAHKPGYLKQHKKLKHNKVTTVTEQNYSGIIDIKVYERLEKLDYSEYLRAKDNAVEPESILTSQMNDTECVEMIQLHSAETEVKEENVTEDEYNETPVNKEYSEYCDLESTIELVEDTVFKTESADLSEFLQETNKDPSIVDDIHVDDEEDESRRKEDEQEEEFWNRVTLEKFFLHLSGSQDLMF